MAELILYAIPAFVLLLIVELLSFKYARDEELVGYELTPLRMPADRWWTYVLLFFADDLAYYQGETERVRYGLTQNIRSFRPTRVAFHEFAAIWQDVRKATCWRHRLGYLFRGPGWSPDGSGGGTRG